MLLNKILPLPALLLLTALLPATVEAQTCVGSIQELRAALALASHPAGATYSEIVLAPGTYALAGEELRLDVRHGRTVYLRSLTQYDFCPISVDRFDPTRTVLDAGYESPLIETFLHGNGILTIHGITFVRGRNRGAQPPVRLEGVCDSATCWSGRLLVEYSHFVGNLSLDQPLPPAPGHGAIRIGAFSQAINTHGRIVIANSSFIDNSTENCESPVQIGLRNWDVAPARIRNNTVVGSDCGVALRLPGNGLAFVENNLFADNDSHDIDLGSGRVTARNNRWRAGGALGSPVLESGTSHLSPGLVSSPIGSSSVLRLVRLADGSPLINAGRPIPLDEGGDGGFDGHGNFRVYQGVIDIGAYEWNDYLFVDSFERNH